jgi:hypothetical protein
MDVTLPRRGPPPPQRGERSPKAHKRPLDADTAAKRSAREAECKVRPTQGPPGRDGRSVARRDGQHSDGCGGHQFIAPRDFTGQY